MNHYIAIEFEVGSGGLEIASGVASKLSLPCYGKEILEMVSKEQGLTAYDIKSYVDCITNSLMYSYYIISQVKNNKLSGLPQEGVIYLEHQKKIAELAKKDSAVFVGQCASEIVKEYGSVLRVFIKADYSDRQKRLSEQAREPYTNVDSVIKNLDTIQDRFYFCKSNRCWNDTANYDLILNTSNLGIDGCIDEIVRSVNVNN